MSISRVPQRSGSFRSVFVVFCTSLGLTACASLPSSGPTGTEIRRAAVAKPGQYPFSLVEVDAPGAIPPAPIVPASALVTMPPRPTDLIGSGDVLNVTVYEAGVSLFGTALRTAAASGTTVIDTS